MALSTWTPSPAPSDQLQVQVKSHTNRIQFGDGYTVRVSPGINTLRRVMELRWINITQAELAGLVAFLEARNGEQAFKYTLPSDATEYVWSCQEWSPEHVKGSVIYNLTAKLTQEFDNG